MKLFLKGDRCYTEKCAIERRAYAPGQHGAGRRNKLSDYGQQLREKQKIKRIYGLGERQFRRFFAEASRQRGVTGERLVQLLEQRLDNVVFRAGFARTRIEARQLVLHGHFRVNGKKVTIPSFVVKPGMEVAVREKSKKIVPIMAAVEAADRRPTPSALEVDRTSLSARLITLPDRTEVTIPMNEQMVVELYSR